MNKNSLITETIIHASPIELWKLITDRDAMKTWYFDIPDFSLVEGANFTFKGKGEGEKYIHKGVILDIVPLYRLTYSWAYKEYPGESEVTFQLNSVGKNKTRVTIIHSGIESFPKDDPNFARESFTAGWHSILNESLKPYAEGAETA